MSSRKQETCFFNYNDLQQGVKEETLIQLQPKFESVKKLAKAVTKKEEVIKHLETRLIITNQVFELRRSHAEKMVPRANSHFARTSESKEKLRLEIEELHLKIEAENTEACEADELLQKYKSYKSLIQTLLPQQLNSESSLSEIPEMHQDNTSELGDSGKKFEQEAEQKSLDPKKLIAQTLSIVDLNLVLLERIKVNNQQLRKVRQKTDSLREVYQKEEQQRSSKLNKIKDQIKKAKDSNAHLKYKIQVIQSIKEDETDLVLKVLDEKVTQVFRSVVNKEAYGLNITEKISVIECRVVKVLDQLEFIPEEDLAEYRRLKYLERMNQLEIEKNRLRLEKLREREMKCQERALAPGRAVICRKPMPRYIPIKKQKEDTKEDPQDDQQLYTEEELRIFHKWDARWEMLQSSSTSDCPSGESSAEHVHPAGASRSEDTALLKEGGKPFHPPPIPDSKRPNCSSQKGCKPLVTLGAIENRKTRRFLSSVKARQPELFADLKEEDNPSHLPPISDSEPPNYSSQKFKSCMRLSAEQNRETWRFLSNVHSLHPEIFK